MTASKCSEGTPLLRVSAGAAVPHDRISAQGLSSDEIELSAGHGNKKCGHWGIGRKRQGSGGAAVVGLIMFALAGMGLFAIFNAIQGATESSRGTTTASTALQAMLGGAVEGEKIDLAEARGEGDDMASSRWIEKRWMKPDLQGLERVTKSVYNMPRCWGASRSNSESPGSLGFFFPSVT